MPLEVIMSTALKNVVPTRECFYFIPSGKILKFKNNYMIVSSVGLQLYYI